ncbi:MAG: EAL domain-containing protein [Geminicoccaceae bacterium]
MTDIANTTTGEKMLLPTASAQGPPTAGLLDENEVIWRRNYLAYGCVFVLLGLGVLGVVLGLVLQSRLLGIAESSVGELTLLRQISGRLDYIFEEGTSEPVTRELIVRVGEENRLGLERLAVLDERISDHVGSISRLQLVNRFLLGGDGELLELIREYREHFHSYLSYLKLMESHSSADPERFFDTHAHFIVMKMPLLLATQSRLTENLQTKISEQQSALMVGFSIMSATLLASLVAIWGGMLVPLRRQIEANCRAIRAQHHQLTYLAHWDKLTELGNRHLFHQTIGSSLAAGRCRWLALIDIDRFKAINDNFGHLYGDGALIAVGIRMREVAGEGVSLFRLGGDEFAMLFEQPQDMKEVCRILGELLEACREPVAFRGRSFNMSVSIGLASCDERMEDSEVLFAAADKALYHAKLHGGDQIARYEELFERSITHFISFDTQLLDAVRLQHFRAFYQPIICLETRRVCRIEALARLIGPDGQLLAPEAWIADAERLGLMSRVSWRILDIVKSEAPLLLDAFPDLESIALNVTGTMLADSRLEDEIRASRRPDGRSWLSIELTEGCMIERGSGNIRGHLERLSEAGGIISLDDFGTGFASLAHLQQIPFDVIKIDRRFVKDIEDNTASRVILEGMIKLAHGLGKQVVCEGIESHPVLSILAGLGCEFGQGYHFCRPHPLERLTLECGGQSGRRRHRLDDEIGYPA